MASYSAVAPGIHHKVLMGLNLKQSRHRGHNGSPLHTSLSRGSARACHETSSHSRAACKPLIWEPLGTPPSVEAEVFLKVTFSVGCRNLVCFVFLNNVHNTLGRGAWFPGSMHVLVLVGIVCKNSTVCSHRPSTRHPPAAQASRALRRKHAGHLHS